MVLRMVLTEAIADEEIPLEFRSHTGAIRGPILEYRTMPIPLSISEGWKR